VMAGRHRRRAGAVPAYVPQQRDLRPVEVTDVRTHLLHVVSQESLAAHRQVGWFLATCGVEVLAASLTDPGRGRCRECAR